MISKLKELISKQSLANFVGKSVNQIKPILASIDEKLTTLIPNPKIKKILYIGIGSLFGFMFLIIILGLLLSPLRDVNKTDGTILNKPKVIISSPEPIKELTARQKEILELEIKIKELRFPESSLNIPLIETNLSIND